ncbi:uncharacterized protein LOC34620021 [Cyclospora cayetanensis]|uniref:Uncharacterized protein n=2 Tax=Cyclospora cayetanensis TaxID=88456 RepID=A0A1D3D153_9EIME|nr:uncharacterized protein LOC34620021 [Cyclospora cayetanensis]OEH77178.1 hypothetical protein cyc_03301 [Cyclospora cayetanensis]
MVSASASLVVLLLPRLASAFGDSFFNHPSPDMSQLLVLTVRDSADAAAGNYEGFDDDIDDPEDGHEENFPPDLYAESDRLSPPKEKLFVSEEGASGNAVSQSSPEGSASSPNGPRSCFPSEKSASANRSPSMGNVQPQTRSVTPPSDVNSQRRGADPSQKSPVETKSVTIMAFDEAKEALCHATSNPDVPWHLRALITLTRGVKKPDDFLHSAYLSSLMQAMSYGLECMKELRLLRHIDKGKAKAQDIKELVALKERVVSCVNPVRDLLAEAKTQLGPGMKARGTKGGWDKAAVLLDSLCGAVVATENNFLTLLSLMEAQRNPQTPQAVMQALQKEREKAKAEYEWAKDNIKGCMRALRGKGILPRAFPML